MQTWIEPQVVTLPRAYKWSITAIGEEEVALCGHNSTKLTVVAVCSAGTAVLSVLASQDGATYFPLPNLKEVTLSTPDPYIVSLEGSFAYIKPVVHSASENFSLYVYAVATR